MTATMAPNGGLRADAVTLGYRDEAVVRGLSLEVPDGRITALIGPNACGKSTLLRGMARLLRPRDGAIYLDGRAIHERPTREVATRLGLLPQAPVVPDGLTVEDLVARGRYPHQSWLRQWSTDDERAVDRALALTGTTDIRDRRLDELSGGQRQRAWIALALAQETPLLLLDEPTTYLDLAHQVEVLDLLHRLNREEGRTIVLVIHDLNLAARYADHLVAMAAGEVRAAGVPAEVLTEALMRDVFGLESRVITDPTCGAPLVLPIARLVPASTATQPVADQPEARSSP